MPMDLTSRGATMDCQHAQVPQTLAIYLSKPEYISRCLVSFKIQFHQ